MMIRYITITLICVVILCLAGCTIYCCDDGLQVQTPMDIIKESSVSTTTTTFTIYEMEDLNWRSVLDE